MPNTQPTNAYVRVLHAVPGAPPVDVYANDTLIARNLRYRGFTEYMNVPSGTYRVDIYPAGSKREPVASSELNVGPVSIYTVAAIGSLQDMDILPILDEPMDVPLNQVCIRFAHISPNTPPVNVTWQNETMIFDDVAYVETTDYLCIGPGRFTIQVRLLENNELILHVPNIRLIPDRLYTLYFIGLLDEQPGLQLLIPLDGNSYIQF